MHRQATIVLRKKAIKGLHTPRENISNSVQEEGDLKVKPER